jgi:hypothetical protein
VALELLCKEQWQPRVGNFSGWFPDLTTTTISVWIPKKKRSGLPLVKFDFKYGPNEPMMEHMTKSGEEMLSKAGFKDVRSYRASHLLALQFMKWVQQDGP